MKLVSIVGARPQFVKIAPVCRAIAAHNLAGGEPIEDVIVHTGQHYDPGMSDVFFEELQIPRADFHLDVGSAPHGVQTARMMEGIESLLLEAGADAVVVYGDTNSTIAGALAAAKMHVPVVHVEAGLRSFNRRMPEEINRVATDHISDLLLAPTPTAMRHLKTEHLDARSAFTGDVMLDAVRHNLATAEVRSRVLAEFDLANGSYGVVTLHRAENTSGARLRAALELLNAVADRGISLVFPVHPRTRAALAAVSDGWIAHPRLRLIPVLGYLDMLWLVRNARLVLTDSGGLQKEALFLGSPCITLRDETEWPETVEAGGNVIAGLDPQRVLDAVSRILSVRRDGPPLTCASNNGLATVMPQTGSSRRSRASWRIIGRVHRLQRRQPDGVPA
ncbi:MAG: UDP-N-acetylglucosamine 2-epimerase (non-hydrolyzing) [Gammaproteobacteria bacterium]|nr:UDP-N-acetylglucosamine 2-epimerase (non-hydrolyzing) [Gammaproteobacteria bacterium]